MLADTTKLTSANHFVTVKSLQSHMEINTKNQKYNLKEKLKIWAGILTKEATRLLPNKPIHIVHYATNNVSILLKDCYINYRFS